MSGADKDLILASQSPRRAELLREAGYDFTVLPSAVEEPLPRSREDKPHQWAEALSYYKARDVAGRTANAWILAADTVVALNGRLYGKAADRAEARDMLTRLAGTSHDVITGVTVLDADSCERLIQHDVTRVTMRPLDPDTIEAYLDSGQWEGKAGAYGIQDPDEPNITGYEGSYSNVVGLPMELVTAMLEQFDIRPMGAPQAPE
jgi:septum formation protein